MSSKTIVVASDHAGVELKSYLIEQLERQGYQVENCGTDSTDSVDYPDFAKLASDKIRSLPNDKPCGILICGSGVGISIAANRDSHIRAALCYNDEIAKLARQHNNANVIVLGARFMSHEEALKRVECFFNTEFEGGRHAKRVEKMS
ncbi:MAG: ribose 5-phosphate isomerase B [Rickettsiales bacterium]|nr:ribose 5-phosphate isomerase B [Rickettsiales bacterium]